MKPQNTEKNRSPRMRPEGFVFPVDRCPLCGGEGTFRVRGRVDDIPYFGETMETLMSCDNCKFRHADVMCLGERAPMRYEFKIASGDDLLVRVVKSSTGTIELPELGITVEPGPASDGYVSNIEGVLDRVEEAIKFAIEGAGATKRRCGEGKLKRLEEVRSGKRVARLIVVDPFGYSAIIDERAKKRKLTKGELASFKAGLRL